VKSTDFFDVFGGVRRGRGATMGEREAAKAAKQRILREMK
jgi:hypothetical protein